MTYCQEGTKRGRLDKVGGTSVEDVSLLFQKTKTITKTKKIINTKKFTKMKKLSNTMTMTKKKTKEGKFGEDVMSFIQRCHALILFNN